MPAPNNRPRCPFYGFHWPERSRTLTDTGGNECALDFERNGPCAMEAQGKDPDYDVCPIVMHIRPLLEAAKNSVVFYPAEANPTGIRMDEWTRQIMTRARKAS